MTTWAEVISYVRTRHEVLQETEDWLRFRLDAEDGRTQQVSVHHVTQPDGTEWIEMSSPVGWADKVDLRKFLELAGTSIICGAAVVDGVALVKHATPLVDLSVLHEFAEPLAALVARADTYERELTGTDAF